MIKKNQEMIEGHIIIGLEKISSKSKKRIDRIKYTCYDANVKTDANACLCVSIFFKSGIS